MSRLDREVTAGLDDVATATRPVRAPLLPRDAWGTALAAWVVARVLVALGHVVARLVDGASSRTGRGLLAWDGGWYELIASNGYRAAGEEVRFAPLFPLLGRIVGFPLGDRPGLGLVLVANGVALVAGVALVGHLRQLRADGLVESGVTTERLAVFAMALWPASFVLVFAYAESLLLALSLLAATSARQGRWLAVAGFGLLAGVARPTGAAVAVLLILVLADRSRPADPGGRRVPLGPLLAASSPVAGFGLHVLAVRWSGASWSAPIDGQSPYRGEVMDPLTRIWRGFGDLLGAERFGDGLHLPFALLAVVLVALVFREIGRAEGLYCAVVVLVALSTENWNSLERYVLNAFPFFSAIGIWASRRRARWAAPALSAIGLVAITTIAWTGHYVP